MDVAATLKTALAQLETQRARLDHQIASLRDALNGVGGRVASSRPPRKRPKMGLAARKAVSRRMKAYWAKRRSMASKGAKRST